MNATPGLPDDPALPALRAISAVGLADAIPALNLDGNPVDLRLRRHAPGRRATLEVWAGHDWHFAVKAYAEDPTSHARLYEALAAGLAPPQRSTPGAEIGVRVPPLLAWDQELRVLVIGWLDGPAANDLIRCGQGRRAGELGAAWLQRTVQLPVTLGPPLSAAGMLRRVGAWIDTLGADDPQLGATATSLLGRLAQSWPLEGDPVLVHGAFYARHVIDLGDQLGVVDWRRHGQGAPELDAGAFLATVWRTGLHDAAAGREAARASEAFVTATADLLDQRALAWYRAAVLLHLAAKQARRPHVYDWRDHARVLLEEALRLARIAG